MVKVIKNVLKDKVNHVNFTNYMLYTLFGKYMSKIKIMYSSDHARWPFSIFIFLSKIS